VSARRPNARRMAAWICDVRHPGELRAAVEQYLQEAHDPGVVNLDARDFAAAGEDRRSDSFVVGWPAHRAVLDVVARAWLRRAASRAARADSRAVRHVRTAPNGTHLRQFDAYLMLIPAIVNGHSGHRDHRFRASRSLIGAKRRRRLVSCASFGESRYLMHLFFLRKTREGLWAVVGGAFCAPSNELVGNACCAFSTARARSTGSFVDRRSPTMPLERRSHAGPTRSIPAKSAANERTHDVPFGLRRVPGSRIVGPFSVSRCA